jgi:hypothetical protein
MRAGPKEAEIRIYRVLPRPAKFKVQLADRVKNRRSRPVENRRCLIQERIELLRLKRPGVAQRILAAEIAQDPSSRFRCLPAR